MSVDSVLRGVVRGNVVVLYDAPGVPDGQEVTVSLQALGSPPDADSLQGLPASFGAWAEDAEDLDAFLECYVGRR